MTNRSKRQKRRLKIGEVVSVERHGADDNAARIADIPINGGVRLVELDSQVKIDEAMGIMFGPNTFGHEVSSGWADKLK